MIFSTLSSALEKERRKILACFEASRWEGGSRSGMKKNEKIKIKRKKERKETTFPRDITQPLIYSANGRRTTL